jgi:hypothetical protein
MTPEEHLEVNSDWAVAGLYGETWCIGPGRYQTTAIAEFALGLLTDRYPGQRWMLVRVARPKMEAMLS